MSTSAFGDGLDLTRPDSFTAEELIQFRAFYDRVKGGMIPAHEFMLTHRPDLLKRHRAMAREMTDLVNEEHPLVHTLSHLHFYCIKPFEAGILYEAKQARAGGATKSDILDTLGIAYILGNPMSTHTVAGALTDYLESWTDPAPADRFPAHWAPDPDAFASGFDYSTAEVLPGEIESIRQWYADTLGEVPAYVDFLTANRPRALKAYRNRLEHLVRGTLPKQAFPYFRLHYAVCSRDAPSMRENILLARAFGLRRSEVNDAICWGLYYGGPGALTLVQQTAGDVLADYQDAAITEGSDHA